MHIRYLLWGLWLLMFSAGLPGCSDTAAQKTDPPKTRKADLVVDSRLVNATNAFGIQLYNKLATSNGTKNLFISPTSIEMALGMTYNGAVGSTQQAMAATLGVKDLTRDDFNKANAQLLTLLQSPDPKVELAIANSLWGRQGFTFATDFLQRNRDYFNATVRTLDFTQPTSAEQINTWVKDNTRGMIPKLVEHPAIKDALLVLINALYFKGKWTEPFDKALTKDGDFTLLNGARSTVPFMHHTGDFQYLETEQFQAVNLPYGDKYVSMYVFLPKTTSSLAEFSKSLSPDAWTKWQAQFHQAHGTLALPRFKADYSTSLKTTLSALGMGECFSDQANFSGMLPPTMQPAILAKPIISDVLHKTALEVNEEGTVAAAVTGVIMVATAMPMNPFTMTVDHPFFLAIIDKPTGAMLFLGSIVKPE